MDPYTRQTKHWLDHRFKLHDQGGIYHAHQPIYGVGQGHSERGVAERYIRTYRILGALAKLRWDTLLDVGGAEGYKAAIGQHVFQRPTVQVDLSTEACKRAREIYALPAASADILQLPFADGAFDVVLCSETLEHVPSLDQALQELLRVAKHAVVITVPHESQKFIASTIRERIPHGHLHSLELDSFDYIGQVYGYGVQRQPILNGLLKGISTYPASLLLEGRVKQWSEKSRYPRSVVALYNLLVPRLAQIVAKPTLWSLLRLDRLLCHLFGYYGAILFVLTKTADACQLPPWPVITPHHVLGWRVPYHYLSDLDVPFLADDAGQAQP